MPNAVDPYSDIVAADSDHLSYLLVMPIVKPHRNHRFVEWRERGDQRMEGLNPFAGFGVILVDRID